MRLPSVPYCIKGVENAELLRKLDSHPLTSKGAFRIADIRLRDRLILQMLVVHNSCSQARRHDFTFPGVCCLILVDYFLQA